MMPQFRKQNHKRSYAICDSNVISLVHIMSLDGYLVTNGPGAVGLELHLSSRTRPYAQTVTLPGDLSASTRE